MYGTLIRIDDDLLETIENEPSLIHDFMENLENLENGSDRLDVDKAWAGIHFLLSGDPWEGELPLGFFMKGPPIGDIDFGMGPALSKRAVVVKSIAEALGAISDDAFAERYDHDDITDAGVYAMGGDPGDDREYLTHYFSQLRKFVIDAANSGYGIIHFVS